MLTLVTFKWGAKYSPAHVENLHAMARRCISVPFRFVVITDEAGQEYPIGIETVPLWPDLFGLGRCYRRLRLFSRQMGERLKTDHLVHLDLDTVILSNITDLVTRPEPALIWKCPSKGPRRYALNPSFAMVRGQSLHEVWDRFARHPFAEISQASRAGWTGSDQAIIGNVLDGRIATVGEGEGLASYRDDHRFWHPDLPPPGVRLVGFYGDDDPSHPVIQRRHPWIAQYWNSA